MAGSKDNCLVAGAFISRNAAPKIQLDDSNKPGFTEAHQRASNMRSQAMRHRTKTFHLYSMHGGHFTECGPLDLVHTNKSRANKLERPRPCCWAPPHTRCKYKSQNLLLNLTSPITCSEGEHNAHVLTTANLRAVPRHLRMLSGDESLATSPLCASGAQLC